MSASEQPGDRTLFAAVFQDLGAGVYTTDHTGRITSANPWAGRLVGRSAAELIGSDAHELLHRDADGGTVPREECKLLATAADDRAVWGSEEYFVRADGSLVPIIWAATPLRLEGRESGRVVVFHDFSLHRSAAEQTAAHLAALEELTTRLSMVAEISSVISATVDVSKMLHRLVRLLVPDLAGWAAADLHSEYATEVERVAVYSAEGNERTDSLEGPLPPLRASSRSALSRVVQSGHPAVLTAEDCHPRSGSLLAEAYRSVFDRLGGHSAVVVPLRARQHVFGALTVARTGDSPPFDDAELLLLADVGRRAGLAMDNAQLYHQQRHVAETMQRQLLTPLPQVDHLRMAARYQPAQSAGEVGGDWYDAFLLADGCTTMIIGDVVGHDLQAAAHMAEVRNMLRALAWDRQEPPSVIMRRLDEAMTNTSDAPMATVVFARVEGEEGGPWQLHWVNAGHPPPLLITSDGTTRYLEGGHGPLLGMSATLELGLNWPDAREDLPPESTVLFYTDGLVESRTRPIDVGLGQLRRHAAALVGLEVDEFCDELLVRMDPRGDDVALLVMRLPGAGAGTESDTRPPPPPQRGGSPAAPDRAAPGSQKEHPEVTDPSSGP
ncbi:SpoIIE family protein phosphatase [Streptomyces sp. ACA25]|uniref:SpoIIE family protein phosphatase n=1 Tax=Streptomyces sp. ACA25 TaxID=3022596 RepID=UPI0023072261|nr:SpoIIE family protein phosphatase [Streptomyces sp. ACA25]MDB1086561.1 SpoIIE family protein phosphatase [Streptomyces sp. ACA25]